MKKLFGLTFVLLITATSLVTLPAAAQEEAAQNPRVVLETSKGQIVVELYPGKAPKTVESFLGYVESGFFEDTIFHRVMPGFMVQGGGYTEDLGQKPPKGMVENESKNGLSNVRGTIAMARSNDPHSATAQFYVNLVDNDYLDAQGGNWGYTVFGKVVEGMDAVDAIAAVETTRRGAFANLPVEPVKITAAAVEKAAE